MYRYLIRKLSYNLINNNCKNNLINNHAQNNLNNNHNRNNLIKTFCTHQQQSNNKTHFGFEDVTNEEKQEKVNDVFSNVASKYDLMNDVMSAGIHRCWKKEFINKLDPLPDTKLLDVAGGTGDITFQFIDYFKDNTINNEITVCDFNENMLKIGQERSKKLGYNSRANINWVQGDAQNLPFDDNSFDVYTIAFGIRNVVNIQKALDESFRVLKPGGLFMCLEFSRVNNPLLERAYDWYSFNIIPIMGELLAKDYKSYKYLVESIRQFPDQNDFKLMIEDAGYQFVEFSNLTFGIACIHSAYKSN